MAWIIGAGGGGGKDGGGQQQRTPVESPDSLNSTQYAQILDLLGEGEIQGLKNGLQSIYLNNTPVQNPDGSLNFQNIQIITRNGTQAQSYIPGSTDIENEKSVGITVQQATPVVRTITDNTVNIARITITVPQLQKVEDNGDINGTDVRLQIAVQYNGGGYTTVIDDTIAGRTADAYQRDYLVPQFTGAFPVDIKVTRITADSNSAKLQNAFNWSSYTEIKWAKLAYPNSALVGLRVDAEQFSSIPSRSYLVRGLKIRIPNNATVDQTTGRLIYNGVWNGTFGAAQWCSDPAWVLFDLLLSSRYGFGDHIKEAQLDKWAFYAASQYASAIVPDGFGGYEPRFSCNVNIQTAEDAYKLINDLCSVMRVMPYWSTGALTISQDRPADTAYLFTPANVTEGGFSYASSSLKNRPTAAVVSYMDLTLRDISREVVEDQSLIAKYGYVSTEISAFATTSRGQAARIGEWLLYSEQYAEVVTFTTSIEAGVVVRPGQIIEIADPVRAGSRRGGRISSATTTTVTIDNTTDITAGAGAELSVIMPDGTVQSRAVVSINGSVLTLASALSAVPNANSIWIYQTSNLQTSTWRVLSVTEKDGLEYEVSALEYNSSKYDYIERGALLQERDITELDIIPDAPTNLTATEVLFELNGRAVPKLLVSWQQVKGVNEYRIRWRFTNGNWFTSTQTSSDYEIVDTKPGVYQIEVYSLNAALRPSVNPAKLTVQAFGKTAPPVAVTGVSLIPIDGASAIVSWDRATELDVLLGGKVLIRHSAALVGATWEESQEIVPAAAGSQTQKQVPLLEGTYLLKFEDDGGNRSVTAATAAVDLPAPQPRLLIQSYREDQETPPFSGNLTDMFYSSELDGLTLSLGPKIDTYALDNNWDGLAEIDGVSSSLGSGEYEFGSTYDMGYVFDVNMRRYFVTRPYEPSSLFDGITDLIDTWPPIDGAKLDKVNAVLYVRSTDDDPGASPVWSDWREFVNALVRGRAFQFKTVATSTAESQNIVIDELGCELELQQRTESIGPLSSGTTAYAVTYAQPFFQSPAVGITAYDMATGDYYVVTSQSRTGFTVTFYNSANAIINRSFAYIATGYGRQS